MAEPVDSQFLLDGDGEEVGQQATLLLDGKREEAGHRQCCTSLDKMMSLASKAKTLATDDDTKKKAFPVILCGGTALMILDQALDALVIIELVDRSWICVATILGLSIILPQVFAWAFLKVNGMASWWALLRILIIPLLGATVLAYFWLVGLDMTTPVRNRAIFCLPMSLETVVLLFQGLAAGKEADEAIWSSFAEGLIEAPASGVLTLYPAILMSVCTGDSPDPIFVLSFLFSMASITRISTKLHFYGMQPRWLEFARVLLLQKLPQVLSQVLGYVCFAFLTRPFPKKQHFEEEVQRSESWLVFVTLAFEVSQNIGILRTVSPRIPSAISVFFATTMVVGSPPGFLNALGSARFDHALQHIASQILMGCMAVRVATEEHWAVLFENYVPFVALYIVAVPSAFIASISMTVDMTPQERLKLAERRLDVALLARDRIMSTLLVDVEQARVQGLIAERCLQFVNVPPVDQSIHEPPWFGIAECGGRLFFCPSMSANIMVLDPSADNEVTFIDTAGEGKGGGTWFGVAECDGRLYFCPHMGAKIMVLDPGADNEVTFIDTGEGEGGEKWFGVAECDGRLYFCPCKSAKIMVLDPGANNEVTFIDTGEGEGGAKWSGVAECGGRLYFCPFDSVNVTILDPGADNKVTFIDTAGEGRGGKKWSGVAECGGRLYFCPFDSAKIMVLDPGAGNEFTFIDTGEGKGRENWNGVAECDGRLYFCPSESAKIMVLDPGADNEVKFIDIGEGEGGTKWFGIAECGGRLYFCPSKSAKIMVSSPSRRHLFHALTAPAV